LSGGAGFHDTSELGALSPSTMNNPQRYRPDEQPSLLILNENDELRQQVHILRLKNAELRNEISKVKRDHQDL
jgi:hypothetical protein